MLQQTNTSNNKLWDKKQTNIYWMLLNRITGNMFYGKDGFLFLYVFGYSKHSRSVVTTIVQFIQVVPSHTTRVGDIGIIWQKTIIPVGVFKQSWSVPVERSPNRPSVENVISERGRALPGYSSCKICGMWRQT